MEKIFNFFRFTNQQYNVFETNKTLVVNVVNADGRVTKIQAFTSSTCAEIISILVEFSESSENVYKGHQLIDVKSGNVINYNTSMEAAGIEENDELCLMKRHKTIKMNTEFKKAPSQAEINEVTGDAENSSEKLFNIKRNFYRLSIGGHSYIRNFLIQMAIESAYIISMEPFADFLIDYFKQKIIGRRKYQDDAVKSLTELGFERSRCAYAIKLKKNVYSEALYWLIDHSEDSVTYDSYNSSISLIKSTSQNVQEKFQRLRRIVRIYGRSSQNHCEKLLETFLEMGFDKEDAINALQISEWDATRAVEIIFDKGETSNSFDVVAQNVLVSPAVQHYLADPEIFMTIVYILASGAASRGIEHNWESTKLKYQSVAYVLKRYNDEKHYNIMNNLNLN